MPYSKGKTMVRAFIRLAYLMLFSCAAIAFAQSGSRDPLGGLPGGLAAVRHYTTARVSSADRTGNADMRVIAPHETLTLAELEGPGEITHIWTTIATDDPNHL